MTKFFRGFLFVALVIEEKSQTVSIESDAKGIANRYERSEPSSAASNVFSTQSASFDRYIAPTGTPLLLFKSATSSGTEEGRNEEMNKSRHEANRNRWSRETISRLSDSDAELFAAKTIKKRNLLKTETKDEKNSRAKNFVRMFKAIYDPKRSSIGSREDCVFSISCLRDRLERENRQGQTDHPEISESDRSWQEALGMMMVSSSSSPKVPLRKNAKTFRFGKRKTTARNNGGSSSSYGDPFSGESLLKSRDADDGFDIRLLFEQDSDLAERLRNLSPKKIRKFRYGKRQTP